MRDQLEKADCIDGSKEVVWLQARRLDSRHQILEPVAWPIEVPYCSCIEAGAYLKWCLVVETSGGGIFD